MLSEVFYFRCLCSLYWKLGLQEQMMGNSCLQGSNKNWECQICALYVSLGCEFL